jgi:beta-fructofuranosidase
MMTESVLPTSKSPAGELLNDLQRPRYHFLPARNWMNDPNGLIHWKGQYHLFYQYNPFGAFHANMHWGHAVSPDLVQWEHLPIALAPTPGGADKDGVFSGCAVDQDGVPTLVYTGVAPEVQCIANGSDDLLTWHKRLDPVIAAPPEGLDVFGFRDPCVWRDGDLWYMALGAGIKDVGGAILLYTSSDLTAWDYFGPLLVDDSGAHDVVWECPAFFPLGDKWVLIVSATPRAYVDYFVGTFDGMRFQPETRRRLDHGRYFYAPQTFTDASGRRLMIGWIWEGRTPDQDIAAGWSGLQSVPRVLSLRPDGLLGMVPIPEINTLRGEHYGKHDLSLRDGVPYQTGVQSSQLEVVLTWQPDGADEVGLVLAQSPNGEEQTRIVYNRLTGDLRVERQQSNAAGDTDTDTQVSPLQLAEGEALNLRIFFDRSSIEIFANDRESLTSRIYPTRPDSLGVSLFASGGAATLTTLEIWEMRSIWP